MRASKVLKIVSVLLLFVLFVSCSKEKTHNEIIDLFSDADIIVSANFEDGKVYEINANEIESGNLSSHAFLDKAFGEYEIYISPRQLGKISERFSVEFFKANKIKFIHYERFDIVYMEYSWYRGSLNGTIFIFENQIYKGCIDGRGRIDSTDTFKSIGDTIWLVTYNYYGGTGLSGEAVNWIELTSIDLNIIKPYYSFEISAPQYVYQFYEESFVDFRQSDSYSLFIVTSYTEKISDPDDVIIFERSGENEIFVNRYTDTLRPNFTMSMLEENLSAIENYAINGSLEEQQVAKEMLEFYNQRKD